MKLPLFLCAALLVCGPAIAADKPAGKAVKPCPKGQVATTSKITGDQHCFAPQAIMVTPVQPAGSKATPPVLVKPN